MKFNQDSLNKFAGGLNLVSGICGDVVSKFYVDCTLAITAKAEELNKAYYNLPEHKEYASLLERKTAERMNMKGNKKSQEECTQEAKELLKTSEEFQSLLKAKDAFMKEEFTIDLPTISIKDLGNVTGSQRLAIHELIK